MRHRLRNRMFMQKPQPDVDVKPGVAQPDVGCVA